MRSDRSARGWALGFAQDYFGWDSVAASVVTGTTGWRHMLALWEREGEGMYARPDYVLRQEWFHGACDTVVSRACPAFFDALSPSATLVDFGCGTAESYRRHWLDRGGRAILMDVETPNLDYVRAKYPQDTVAIRPVSQGLPTKIDALLCLDVLEHLRDPMPVLRELWEHLRPGGQALLWFDGTLPAAGHYPEAIAQLPAYDWWVQQQTIPHYRGMVDWLEKPRRWWQVLA